MGKRRDDRTESIQGILRCLVDIVYGPPDAAAVLLQAFAAKLFEVMVFKPLPLPGFSLVGTPSDHRFLHEADWGFPAAEVCADLRRLFDHLVEWKKSYEAFGNGAEVRQTGVAIPMTVRMSVGNDGKNLDRHFLALQGPPKDVFVAIVLLLLAHGTTAKVLACPECRRVFVRADRRQTHCGKKCYDVWYWREKYTPQRKAKARRAQYKKHGWKLGSKGSPLGRLKSPTKSDGQSSSKGKGE